MEMKGHNIIENDDFIIISPTAGLMLLNDIEQILTNAVILPENKGEIIIEKLNRTDTDILCEAYKLYRDHIQSENPDITDRDRRGTANVMMLIENVFEER